MIITTGFTDLSAEAHRNQTAALLATTTTLDANGTPAGLQVFGGVHSGFYHAKTGAMAGTVAAGRAVVPGTNPEDGAWVVTMTEPEPFTIEDGDGVYTRRDLVCLQIDTPPVPVEGQETPVLAGAKVVVVKGTGVTSGTPPTPAAPTNAIPLWAITVGPNTTVANAGYSATADVIDSRVRLKLANQDRQPFAMAAGNINVAMTSTKNWGSASISFPAGRFRFPPVCVASLATAPGNSGKVSARVINATTTGATVMCYTGDNAVMGANHTVTVHWQAVQMSEDAAAG